MKSPIMIFSPVFFHVNRWGKNKCNCSLEEHLRKPKSRRGSFIGLELFILSKTELKYLF